MFPPSRIVCLTEETVETLYLLGEQDRIVGISGYVVRPPQARREKPRVSAFTSANIDKILALKPDLVLAWQSGNRTGDYERLEKLGYPVFVAESRRLDDVARALRVIGELAGTRPEAGRAAAAFERGVRQLRERYAKAAPVRVFYSVWSRPFMTVSGAHIISDVIALCGGINVFADMSRTLTPLAGLNLSRIGDLGVELKPVSGVISDAPTSAPVAAAGAKA